MYAGVSLAKHIILNLLIFACLMLMVATALANQYSVINYFSSVSHFSLCNYCSLHRLSLSSFPRSFHFHMVMQQAIQFIIFRDMNDYTKTQLVIVCYTNNPTSQIWSISNLNSLFIVTRMTVPSKYRR